MKPHKCEARYSGGQMLCVKCNLVWDLNDPDPPMCPLTPKPEPEEDRLTKQLMEIFKPRY